MTLYSAALGVAIAQACYATGEDHERAVQQKLLGELDLEGILIRQAGRLEWAYVEAQLRPLVELKEEPEILERLERILPGAATGLDAARLEGRVGWRATVPDRLPMLGPIDDPRGPDFTIFVYGGGFLEKEDKTKFREGFSVPADAPPCFFVVAHNDNANPIEAAKLYIEYKIGRAHV